VRKKIVPLRWPTRMVASSSLVPASCLRERTNRWPVVPHRLATPCGEMISVWTRSTTLAGRWPPLAFLASSSERLSSDEMPRAIAGTALATMPSSRPSARRTWFGADGLREPA
jgi:hypothetical protein